MNAVKSFVKWASLQCEQDRKRSRRTPITTEIFVISCVYCNVKAVWSGTTCNRCSFAELEYEVFVYLLIKNANGITRRFVIFVVV